MKTYFSCQITIGHYQEYHPVSPLLDFMLAFSQIDSTSCQTVLRAGFLDMLLCMYVSNFECSMMTISVHGKAMIMEACTDGLLQLCEQPGALAIISAHPLHALWPKSRPLSLRLWWQRGNRPSAWSRLGSVIVARRLNTIPSILELPIQDVDSNPPHLIEACIDLVEFSRHVDSAPSSPYKCLV